MLRCRRLQSIALEQLCRMLKFLCSTPLNIDSVLAPQCLSFYYSQCKVLKESAVIVSAVEAVVEWLYFMFQLLLLQMQTVCQLPNVQTLETTQMPGFTSEGKADVKRSVSTILGQTTNTDLQIRLSLRSRYLLITLEKTS